MIITCENCHTRYLVASSSIGEEGRIVRCTNCGHEWFQEYERIDAGFIMDENEEEDDASLDDTEDLTSDLEAESIPQGVRPIPEDISLPARREAIDVGDRISPRLAGYIAAFIVFAAIAILLAVFRKPVIESWPPSAGLYELVGLMPALPGEGLLIDQLVANTSINDAGISTLEITGSIVNLTNRDIPVPSLLSELRTEQGKVYDVWAINPPTKVLAPQQDISFSTSYPGAPGDVTAVNIRFAAPE